MKTMNIRVAIIVFISLVISTLFSACEEDEPATKAGTYYGNEVSLGNGKAQAWVTLDAMANPTSLGITLTKGALENLPAGGDHSSNMFTLGLPAEKAKTPFDHISLDWNPHGHEPDVYVLPHFDIHFYMMTGQERQAIGADDPKIEILPDAKFFPANYVATPGGVPQMGKHWVDVTSPELNGGTFTYTFIYGSYDGKVNFYEPMITREYLLSNPNKTIELGQPLAFQKSGYYPAKYTIKYDSAKEEYVISLDELAMK